MSDNKKKKDLFDKLADLADTEYETEIGKSISAANEQMQLVDQQKQEITKKLDSKQLVLKDQEYIDLELKTLIQTTVTVLNKLAEDIRIGSHARQFEVYATLANSLKDQIRELRDMNRMLAEMEMFQSPEEKDKSTVNINMTGKEMIEMYRELQKNIEINRVDAEFEIEDSKDEEENE